MLDLFSWTRQRAWRSLLCFGLISRLVAGSPQAPFLPGPPLRPSDPQPPNAFPQFPAVQNSFPEPLPSTPFRVFESGSSGQSSGPISIAIETNHSRDWNADSGGTQQGLGLCIAAMAPMPPRGGQKPVRLAPDVYNSAASSKGDPGRTKLLGTIPTAAFPWSSPSMAAAGLAFQTGLISKLRAQGILKGPSEDDLNATAKAAADAKKHHRHVVGAAVGGSVGGAGLLGALGYGGYRLHPQHLARKQHLAHAAGLQEMASFGCRPGVRSTRGLDTALAARCIKVLARKGGGGGAEKRQGTKRRR